MTISVKKSIPSSVFYSGSGETEIILRGVNEIIANTKKSLIKMQIPRSSGRQTSNPTEFGDNRIKDLQRVEDTLKFRAFLEDDDSETAWNKYWKLRAMCATGGALSELVIENLTFDSSTVSAFIEEVSGTLPSFQGKRLNENSNLNAGRIEIDITFYLGEAR